MPVVTTAENPPTHVVVPRSPAQHRPDPDIACDVSEYGRFPVSVRVHPGAVKDVVAPHSSGYAPTPLGRVVLVAAEGRLVGLAFDDHSRTLGARGRGSGPHEIISAA